jgi:bacillithiol biosynthesis cysteine-adding enzyme BshC
MEQIEFNKLKYFSSLFKDFINVKDFISNRFPSNNLIQNDSFFTSRINETFNKRIVLIDSIIQSMQIVELSTKQKYNLEQLKDKNTLAVVTGQQPGFLGGPLYTILKSISAIIKSNQLKEKYPYFNFIPLFWVEDNDHDLDESASAVIFDNNFLPINVKLDFDYEGIAAYQKFDETISDKIDNIIEKMPRTDLGSVFLKELKQFYKPGNSWSDAFIAYNSYLTEKFGMLFVKSSDLSNSGIFKELIIEEITNPGKLKSLVEKVSLQLSENGYHIQANPSDINLFFHKKSLRHRIEFSENKYFIDEIELSKSDILEIAEQMSGNFSPKVLLRPVFQDYIIPTASYIGGPGEIAYLAQIKELYMNFNLTMPMVNIRHSVTFIDKSTKKGLDKFKQKTEYFMRDFSIIEMELASESIDEETERKFSNSSKSVKIIFNELIEHLNTIDPQIEKTAATSMNKIEEQIENLKKKTISFLKRQEEEKFNKFKRMSNFIYPRKIPQERVYSSANFIAQIGLDKFLAFLFQLKDQEPNCHLIINLSENNQEL